MHGLSAFISLLEYLRHGTEKGVAGHKKETKTKHSEARAHNYSNSYILFFSSRFTCKFKLSEENLSGGVDKVSSRGPFKDL